MNELQEEEVPFLEAIKARNVNLQSHVDEMIKRVNDIYVPANNQVLYLVSFKLRDEAKELKDAAPDYVSDPVIRELLKGDKAENISKQKLWLIAKGPEATKAEGIPLGSRLAIRGNAFEVLIRFDEDTEDEQEFIFLSVESHNIIGYFK